MATFKKGDRVAWSHSFSTEHAEGSIVRADVVKAKAPDAKFGTVVEAANEEKTWFSVQLDGDKEPAVLTEDELVKVAGEDG